MKKLILGILLMAVVMTVFSLPVLAAQAEQPTTTAPQQPTVNWKAISAALAVAVSALASAWAQSKIGSAAAGALAEKPELGGILIVLEAIPETMIILGFVVALLIMVMA
jgi:V/A-type H+-transporting ATPase subunit K